MRWKPFVGRVSSGPAIREPTAVPWRNLEREPPGHGRDTRERVKRGLNRQGGKGKEIKCKGKAWTSSALVAKAASTQTPNKGLISPIGCRPSLCPWRESG